MFALKITLIQQISGLMVLELCLYFYCIVSKESNIRTTMIILDDVDVPFAITVGQTFLKIN